jgi:shikimate dehydrogenase
MKGLGLKGANVTVPHKEAAAAAADRCEGAVANVLRWEPDGSVSAFNTDGTGLIDTLDAAAPDWRDRVQHVLIVGAGGGARGVADALAPHVAAISVINRTPERAAALAAAVDKVAARGWSEMSSAFAQADLIINATTLGMNGNESPDWPVASCKASAIVVDIVYRPLDTPLLKAARGRGLATADGLSMLIHQGVRSFNIWFGISPDADAARTRLEAALGEAP